MPGISRSNEGPIGSLIGGGSRRMRAIRPLQGLRTIEPVFILQRAASGRIEVAMQGRAYLIVRLVIGRGGEVGKRGTIH